MGSRAASVPGRADLLGRSRSRRIGQRAAVVTGASSGIGEACALRLARLGWRVFAGVRRDEDAERLRRERLTPLRLDVTDAVEVSAAAESVARAVGGEGLAGLVNNAGIALAAPLELLPLAELRRQLEVNVVGQLAVTQAFLPQLRAASGRIVNVGSISGRSALPFLGPYAASKFALEALTDSLRVELAPWRIGVSIVEPGTVATPIWTKSAAAAERISAALPEAALDLYRAHLAAFRASATRRSARGIAAEAVARAVEHALTASRPRTRYLVGRDAKLRAGLERLPDRVRDRALTRLLLNA